MNKKNKPKVNITKFLTAPKKKKYLYLKQALGNGEITRTQMSKLAYFTNKVIFDRHARRIEANSKRILIPKTDTA